MSSIYLDNNATTRIDPQVVATMAEVAGWRLANPASQHREGAKARRLLEDYRLQLLEMLGARTRGMATDRLLLTSGGTESNNLALLGLARPGTRVLISSIEHPSITAAGQYLAAANYDVRTIPVDSSGVIKLNELDRLLQESETSLVAVMMANNETGVIQPVADAVALSHRHGARFHCDAVQWAGKRATEFATWDVDSLSVSCHKFHGPVGIGALCLRHGVGLTPRLFGGFQQDGLRPGTESVVLAAGFATAMQLSLTCDYSEVAKLREKLETGLMALSSGVQIHGRSAPRMPHTTNVSFPTMDRQAFLLAADLQGLCLSAGSACASGSSEPSPVLLAMGLERTWVQNAVRISLGRDTTAEEIDRALLKIDKILTGSPKR